MKRRAGNDADRTTAASGGPSSRSYVRVLVKRVLFAALPLLVLVAVAELTARAWPHRDEFATNTGFVDPDPDPDLLWRLRPIASGPLATNELGLRDGPYRPDADVTILLLGDSVSWGNGIGDLRRVYPFVLERALERERPGRTFEVINASVPGYSTFQELRYLELHGAQLAPDAIVLQFCLNDVVERYRALAAYGGNDFFLGVDTRTAIRGIYGTMVRRSRAFAAVARWLQHLARDREQYRARSLSTDFPTAAIAEAWSRVERELEGVRREAAALGAPLLIAIAPYLYQVEDPARMRQPQDRLLSWAAARGVRVVDLLPYVAAAGRDDAAALFSDANHFSERGHALVAHVLVTPLLELTEGS